MELRCCGQYLETGECCASTYGVDRLILEEDDPDIAWIPEEDEFIVLDDED